MRVHNNKLYLAELEAEVLAREYGTPLYAYEEDVIRTRYNELVAAIPYSRLRIHYACKANANVEILRLLRGLGSNIETVSRGEVLLALKAGFTPDQILYTCSNISEQELRFAITSGVTINLDSLTQLRRYAAWKPGSSVSIRINQGIGAGHHPHVSTGGPESKFGIDISQLEEAIGLAKEHGLRISGVHQHIGSNILDVRILIAAMQALLDTAIRFEDLEFVDIGGGLGVPCRLDEKALDIGEFGKALSALFAGFCQRYGRELTLILEPGRYLVAEAGTLLTTVTEVKRTPWRTFVGVDTGFNHLLRPALYGAYHAICNASRVQGEEETVSIAGNLCESGDLLAKDRTITRCKEGDIVAILNAGAYGFAMSSNYNSRPKPAEVMVSGTEARVIRARESEDLQ